MACRLAPLDALLAEADLVTLHASLSESTRGLVGRRELRLMRAGSWLINTARGALIDEDALLDALEDRHLAGAALDVLAEEHGGGSGRLLDYARTHDNLIVTPHIGGATIESREKTEALMADRLWSSCVRRAAAMALEVLGLVPARGGSKRVPDKNLAELGGRSLVRRALDTASAAKRVKVTVAVEQRPADPRRG